MRIPATTYLLLCFWTLYAGSATSQDLVEPLTRWIEKHGGQVSAKAADAADPSQGVAATTYIAEGEIIATIPFSTCYVLPRKGAAQDVAADMLRHAADPSDWYQPLWASGLVIKSREACLPAGIYSFPEEYLPYLAAPDLAGYVRRLQSINTKHWNQLKAELEPLGITYEQFSLMVHIVGTKSFQYVDDSYLIPLVDLATHQFRCNHFASITSCTAPARPPPTPEEQQQQQQQEQEQKQQQKQQEDWMPAAAEAAVGAGAGESGTAGEAGVDSSSSSSSQDEALDTKASVEGLCVAWFAGEDVEPGGLLCSTYGVSYSDEALLQFGVVMHADPYQGPELAAVDTRMFNPRKPFKLQEEGTLDELEGDTEALIAEKKRLLSRIQMIDASKAAVAAAQPVPEDKDGCLLAAIRAWREIRRDGLRVESGRVDQAIEEMWSGMDDDDFEPVEPPAFVSAGSKKERAAKEQQQKIEL